MAIKLKKTIKDKLESILNEKGFYYDQYSSASGTQGYSYVKFYENVEGNWVKEARKTRILPKFESIIIYKSQWLPEMTVDLKSTLKRKRVNLGALKYETDQKWWLIETEEQVEESFADIIDLLNEYAWGWFTLTKPEE